MPRPKFRSKYGNKSQKRDKNKKFGGNKVKNNKKAVAPVDSVGKKYKFIRRNQESEEALRRQQQLEENFKERNAVNSSQDAVDEFESSEEDENPMEQLLSTLSTGGRNTKTDNAIESASEESAMDEDEDESNEDEGTYLHDIVNDKTNFQSKCFFFHLEVSDDGDDPFPEMFEEQSQPRGRKYRSSEEEDAEEEEEDGEQDSDDDLPEDTVLRPEQADNSKHFDDSFENNEDEDSDESDPSENEKDSSDDEDENKTKNVDADKFNLHLGHDLSLQLLESMNTTHLSRKEIVNWPILGRLQVEIATANADDPESSDGSAVKKKKKLTLLDDDAEYAQEGTIPTLIDHKSIDLERLGIKVQLQPNVVSANKSNLSDGDAVFTNLQTELFSVMNNYQDLFYPQRSHANGEEIRFTYCLHALNHVMKTRTKVLNHNLKLKMMDSKAAAIVPDKYRDQGLFRTKVLIVVPFRESALRIVKMLVSLLFPSANESDAKQQVMHYKRFLEEFGGETLHFPKKNPKPEDYELTFAGNSDDTFRLGLTFTRKCIKLYSDFYSSDILIVSPLGLRMIVGAPGDKNRDYDFLASIELLILDQAEIFLAQNWDHLLHVLDHLHLQPQSARNTDFSRVRAWCLNGWSRFYRQTMLFSSHELAEFRSLFNSRCSNYRGKVRIQNPIVNGSIKLVAVQIPQTFHRIDVSSIQSSFDQRFDYFINKILPQYKSASKAHCLIFIPSYFDFVRIRNYFKKETMNFTQICEYTKVG